MKMSTLTPAYVRRLAALYMHPLMHRRELFSIFQCIYKWLDGFGEHEFDTPVQVPARVARELIGMGIFSPIMTGSIRVPIDSLVSCTDATPSTFGICEAPIKTELTEPLFTATEYKGAYARLQSSHASISLLHPEIQVIPPDPLIGELAAMDWEVVRGGQFRESHHVNLQELSSIFYELRSLGSFYFGQVRHISLTDSWVSLAVWAKGRSSSGRLNGIMRRALAWSAFSGISFCNLHVMSKHNPADDPSWGVTCVQNRSANLGWRNAWGGPRTRRTNNLARLCGERGIIVCRL